MSSGYSNDRTPLNAEPPRDADGKRLDGPTIEEFVKAGYLAENYPPGDYAAKDSAGWQAELERRGAPVPSSASAGSGILQEPLESMVPRATDRGALIIDSGHAPTEDEAADLGRPDDMIDSGDDGNDAPPQ
jgi:hypothetical protein